MINKLLFILNNYSKKYLFFIIFLMSISSLLEMLSIGSLIPLTSYIFKANTIFYFKNYITIEIILITFGIIYILKNIFSIYFLKKYSTFLGYLSIFFQKKLFIKNLNLEYSNFFSTNPSNLIQSIKDEVNQFVNEFIDSLLLIILNTILIISIFIILLFYNPLITIGIFLFLFLLSFLLLLITKKQFIIFGLKRKLAQINLIKYLRDTFQSLKELKLYNKQDIFLEKFDRNNKEYVKIGVHRAILGALPRLLIETALVLFLVFIIFINKNKNNLNDLLAILSIFIFAAYKLIPSFLIIIRSYQKLTLSSNSLFSIYNQINVKDENFGSKSILKFLDRIDFINISFSYDQKLIYKSLNLTIKKGDFIGIYGKSGSGKSTFVDLFSGLIAPTNGKILVDGADIKENIFGWRNIASIQTQKGFLFDDSLLVNITLETDHSKVNKNLLDKAIEESCLVETINDLPKGIMTRVGDLGKNLSGGQLQRLMLARALYFNKDILILDEPTNAFDYELENNFMKNLDKIKRKKTIILISHNLKILNYCDQVYKLENYNLNKINIFDENIF